MLVWIHSSKRSYLYITLQFDRSRSFYFLDSWRKLSPRPPEGINRKKSYHFFGGINCKHRGKFLFWFLFFPLVHASVSSLSTLLLQQSIMDDQVLNLPSNTLVFWLPHDMQVSFILFIGLAINFVTNLKHLLIIRLKQRGP